jgi:hypothetical protein
MAAAAGVAILVLLVLFTMVIAGIVLLVFARRRGAAHPACGQCGYDVSGSLGAVARCSECGADFAAVGITPPRSTWNKPMLVVGLLLIVLPAAALAATFLGVFVRAPAPVPFTVAPRAPQPPNSPPAGPEPISQTAPEGEVDVPQPADDAEIEVTP